MAYHYFSTIRHLVGGFGSMFSDINIKHKDTNGDIAKSFRVPLKYGTRNAWLAKLKEREKDTNVARTAITLPQISFQMGQMAYASDRANTALTRTKRIQKSDTLKDKIFSQLQKVPYDFSFSVNVYAKNMEDGLQIVEQILPRFNPEETLLLNEIPELDLSTEVKIDLVGVSPNDTFEGSISNTKRILTWDFDFVVRGYIYQPIKDSALIKEIQISMYEEGSTTNETIDVNVNPLEADEDEDWNIEINGAIDGR